MAIQLTRRRSLALLLGQSAWITTPSGAQDYFSHYAISREPKDIDIAIQPKAYPLAFISTVMQHDRILKTELKTLNVGLRMFPYKKGNDILQFLGHEKLEAAFLGDMPVINAIVSSPMYVIGLGKRNFSTVIARDYGRIDELRGKRIGYSAGSSSHLVLLRALRSARMTEKDVVLVSLEPSRMPDALQNGTVDAFSAWEPTPAIALAQSPKNRPIYRGMSSDWFVISRPYVERHPQASLAVIAAYARAINWMRASAAHTEKAARWVLAEGQAFDPQEPVLTVAQAARIVKADLLDVPGAPAVPSLIDGDPPLLKEFGFLKEQKLLPPQMAYDVIREAFSYQGLRQVQSEPKRFGLFVFDYAE